MQKIISFAILILFLWLARSILIPLLVAVFFWYLINAIATYYRKVMPFPAWRCKNTCYLQSKSFDWISKILATLTLLFVIYLFATQVRPMFSELVVVLPSIQAKLLALGNYLSSALDMKFDANLLPNMNKIASSIGASAASLATSLGMIMVYMLFMFIEQSTFDQKFHTLFSNKLRSKKAEFILNSIDENMRKYLFVKTFISAMTGLCSYIWLHAIGLEFAGVWAFIIFIANYIPTIGSIVACSLPIIYSLAITGDLHMPLLTACGLIGLQILFGNIIEPRLTGKTLNLSTLAILINLVFWGMVWGIAGMFFSVPLLVATFIITAQFESTRWIAILLSADGKIPDRKED